MHKKLVVLTVCSVGLVGNVSAALRLGFDSLSIGPTLDGSAVVSLGFSVNFFGNSFSAAPVS